MKQVELTVERNGKIAANVFEMVLSGDTSAITAPGQFINIKLDGFFLRRPISVCDYDGNSVTIIYKTVGAGTEAMSQMKKGTKLDTLIGLGNGYDTAQSGDAPLLIGGGVGVPPMYRLCKELVREGKRPTVILGFNSAQDVFYEQQFADAGAKVLVATADGSYGVKGFVTDVMDGLEYSYFYACGPEPMLRAVYNASVTGGELSLEERMGCGFGACMGCSCKTITGSKRICKEGPVLKKEEILW